MDTTGFAAPRILLQVADETDLFLYDIKTMNAELHRRTTGVPLAPILANLERLLARGARVRVRLPLIPGVSDSFDHIDEAGDFLAERGGVEAVHLLPFHRAARSKHDRFGLPWRLTKDGELPKERIQEMSRRLEGRGLHVTIGG